VLLSLVRRRPFTGRFAVSAASSGLPIGRPKMRPGSAAIFGRNSLKSRAHFLELLLLS